MTQADRLLQIRGLSENGVRGSGLIRQEMAVADTTELSEDAMIDPVTGEIIDPGDLEECLLAQAKEQGVSQVGPGGLLGQLTKNVLETALEQCLRRGCT